MVDAVRDYAIFMLDPDGYIRSWNPGAELLKGYAAEDVLGRHFSLFYPPEQRESGWPDRELELALRDGRMEDEGWRLRKDGTRFWASVVITALRDADGTHRGYAKVTRDLTERRLQEELLRQSDERFRLLVEGVRDYAIFMLESDGRVASWNLGAELTKGYTADEIIGRHFSVFYPPELIEQGWPRHELEMALAHGRFEDEGWRLRKDGTRFWASVVITALFDEHGAHRGYAKVTRDLTERKRVSMLEDESRHLTQFLAVLGHELRNPLAPISNAVSLLQHGAPTPERLTFVTDVLARQVPHLRRLVEDLLDVGRIVSGKIHLDRQVVRLQSVVDDAVEAAAPLMQARGHAFEVDACAEALWVIGDPMRLVQVLGNLLHNAAKFTPEGGSVRLALRADGPHAELAVSDNGPGIPERDLSYVFKLFAQGERDASLREHDGLGIGLSLAHQLVAQHGGEISVFSRGEPGRGAEFRIRLPRIDDASDAGWR
ncbi:PAS domain-containing sensor histidine kinase [Cognatilysobacter tabacisoli]